MVKDHSAGKGARRATLGAGCAASRCEWVLEAAIRRSHPPGAVAPSRHRARSRPAMRWPGDL